VLRELTDGVYYESQYTGGNVAVIRGDRGSLLIDVPMLPPDTRQWQLELYNLGIEEIYGIVNTDYHPEHYLGNALFMPVRVFGHKMAAKPIAKYATSLLDQVANTYRSMDSAIADEILDISVGFPEVMVGDLAHVHLGNRCVQVLAFPGHTPASLGVYLPDDKILFAGDNIANNEHPVMVHGVSLEWQNTLKQIKAMDIDLIIPGVGEPCGKEVIDPMTEYIGEMRRRILDLFQNGASRRECVDKVGMMDWFPVPDEQAALIKKRRRENVERIYTEIRTALRKKKR